MVKKVLKISATISAESHPFLCHSNRTSLSVIVKFICIESTPSEIRMLNYYQPKCLQE